MKSAVWLALLLLMAPCLARAQDTEPSDAPDKQTDYNKIVAHFFDDVKATRYTAAAHVLVDTNAQDEFNVDKHESLAIPLQKIGETFGTFKMFKVLVSKTLGDGIGYVYGLAIYDRSPIRFEFMFYKDGDDWRLLHIDFNLNYVPEIRDLAGVHIQATPVFAQPPGAPAPAAPAPPAAKPKSPDNPEPPASSSAPANGAPTLSAPPTNSAPASTGTSTAPSKPAPDSPTPHPATPTP